MEEIDTEVAIPEWLLSDSIPSAKELKELNEAKSPGFAGYVEGDDDMRVQFDHAVPYEALHFMRKHKSSAFEKWDRPVRQYQDTSDFDLTHCLCVSPLRITRKGLDFGYVRTKQRFEGDDYDTLTVVREPHVDYGWRAHVTNRKVRL